MFDHIQVLIKLLLFQIAFNSLLTRFLCCCFIILFLVVYYYYKPKNIFNIKSLKIHSWADIVPFLVLFSILYLGGICYLRYCSFGSSLDIKAKVTLFLGFIQQNAWNYILITLIFYILLIILFLMFLSAVSKSIKFNLYKIHIYIISKDPKGFNHDNFYDKFCRQFKKISISIEHILPKLYKTFLRLYFKYIKKQTYKYKFTKTLAFFYKLSKFNALIILLFLTLYDIGVNNFVLTKIYYFLPIAFIYNFMVMLYDLTNMLEAADEVDLANFLYVEITEINLQGEIYFANGCATVIEDLHSISNTLTEKLG